MSLVPYTVVAVTDNDSINGRNVQGGIDVEVYVFDGLYPADIFEDQSGTTPISFFKTSFDGSFSFFIEAGEYRITVGNGPPRHVLIGGGSSNTAITKTYILGILDLSASGDEVFITVNMNSNITEVRLPNNSDATTAITQTIIFNQTGGGGFTVAGWPVMDWENGLLPVIDTTVGGRTIVQILTLAGQLRLGVM